MDGGSEYQAILKAFLIKKGIESDITTHYSPESNGISERLNRTLLDMARTMLFGANLPTSYGQRQFLLLYISRIGFLILAFVGMLLLMRCDSESSRPYLIFVFSAVPLTFTSLRNVAKDMPMAKSAIVLFTRISSDTTNRTGHHTKSGIRRTIPLFAQGTSSSTRPCIIRTKATSISHLS